MSSTLKQMWWTFCAAMKGLDYEDYLRFRKHKLEAEIARLPDAPNLLSFYGQYYSFISKLLTLRVLTYPILVVAAAAICLWYFDLLANKSIIFLVAGFMLSQVAMVALGVFVRVKYSADFTTQEDDRA